MTQRRAVAALVVIVVSTWFAGNAVAQSRTAGVLAGRVVDPNGVPLPGASVSITSPALIGGSNIATTDARGRFRFSELPPGEYRVIASLGRYSPSSIERVKISVGMTAEVETRMVLLGGGETVVVRAVPPAIDPTSSAAPTILTRDFLRHIPIPRESDHILDVAPGINIESAYGGGEESGNAYEMDGVDISDPQAGKPWTRFNYSIVDEVQLIGLGAPAEYGQFTGVVFNSVTKSGGNDSSGSAELYYGGQAITGNSPIEDVNASIDSDLETAFQLGGPVKRDRLWYFVSGQYHHINSTEGGPTQREITPRVFAKLTAQRRENSTLHGWVQWDHTRITGRDATDFTPIEATTGEDNPNIVGNVAFDTIASSSSVLSAAWSGYSGHNHFNPANGFSTPGHFDAQTGFASVNAQQFGIVERSRNQLNASFSHETTNLITGYHDWKVGTELERSRVHDKYGFPGGAFFSDNEGPIIDPSTRKSDFYSLVSLGGGYDAHGRNERLSFYVEDSWRITPRFTLNPGVRIDRNRGNVTGATVFRTNGVAPRLGFAWDLAGDGRSVVKAHAGRYYEALYSAFYYYMDPGAFAPLTTKRIFNTSGFTETLTTTPGQQYAMDPHIRQPHLDQYLVGFDRQIADSIVLSGTLVVRRNADLIETVSRDGIFVPVQGKVPGTGQTVTLYDYLNPNTDVLIYTNPPGLHRNYRAAIISVERPLRDDWQMAASYVFSRTRGNIDNLGFDEFGRGGNTPFFDGHFLDTPNSLVNAEGRLTHDQTHQVKLQGTWVFPIPHLSLSADYTIHSGDTWTPQTTCLLTTTNGVEGCHDFPQGPVLYFAESRGSRRLKARNEINFRTEWQHRIRGGRQFRFDFDVFNLLNRIRPTSVETRVGPDLGQAATANFAWNIRLGFVVSW